MLAIKNNMMSLNAARNLGISYGRLSTSVERLSSGLRINSAKDDAAGLAVRELIRADVAALNQGVRNANDGVSMLQAAEGALGQIDSILIRMKELVEQANTGTYSSTQTDIMQAEFNELSDEIDRIATSTNFNDMKLLDPTGPITISLGQGSGTGEVTITGQDMQCAALGIGGTKATVTGPLIAAVGNEYIGDGDAGETDTIRIAFDGQNLDIDVDGGVSLTTLVDRINAASRAAVSGWNAASIRGDAVHGYQLELTAWNTGADANLTITADQDGGGNDSVWGADVYSASGSVSEGDMVVTNGTGTALDVTSDTAAGVIQAAIETKDGFRAQLGYKMNRLEAAAAVLAVQAENLSAAESRISDVDVATEMSEMTRAQVLAQAGIAMLAQANTMPHMALQLLQS